MTDMVILIHGLGRGAASMWILAWRLRRAGFKTRCIGYPSTQNTIAQNEALLREKLAGLGPVDLVGHSLGGFLSARLLRDPQGLEIRQIVQIGAPNNGSPLADRMSGFWPVRRLCGPVVAELNAHAKRRPQDSRIASIAGTGGWVGIPLPRPHDGAVTVRSAWAGARYRTAVPVLHTVLPISARVAKRVVEILSNGKFTE